MSKRAKPEGAVLKKLSPGEEAFALHCHVEGLTPEREYSFHPTRKWRFDFAFPDRKIAVEIEGGIHKGGRHSRGSGFEKDAEKYNAAAKMEWLVLRYSTAMVESGQAINDVLELVLWKRPPATSAPRVPATVRE